LNLSFYVFLRSQVQSGIVIAVNNRNCFFVFSDPTMCRFHASFCRFNHSADITSRDFHAIDDYGLVVCLTSPTANKKLEKLFSFRFGVA